MKNSNQLLLLDNQLCFALYLASKSLTQVYQPLLEPLDLTYPQYLVLLVLWEHDGLSVKAIGERLHLDSGTLSPLLKKLEAKSLLRRARAAEDERLVHILLTAKGLALQSAAATVPECLARQVGISKDELRQLLHLLKSFNQTLAKG